MSNTTNSPKSSPAPNGRHSERVMDALQAAILTGAYDDSGLTDIGIQHAIENLRSAMPVARSIVMLGSPLESDSGPLDRHIDALHRAIDAKADDAIDPDHACDKAAATADARHFVGIAIGLLLADLV